MMEADGMPLLLRFLVRIYGSEVRSNACAWQNSGGLIHPGAETMKVVGWTIKDTCSTWYIWYIQRLTECQMCHQWCKRHAGRMSTGYKNSSNDPPTQ